MNAQHQTSAGLRRAALALHSLGQADRDWLLQQLPPTEQHSLAGLLAELNELGIAPDAAVIRAALNEASPSETMSAVHARELCLVLASEMPAMQGLLLAALPEAQRAAVLRHWPYELVACPRAVAERAWAPVVHDAVMQSWMELALAREEKAT